jgi:hypothetical protein
MLNSAINDSTAGLGLEERNGTPVGTGNRIELGWITVLTWQAGLNQ